MAPLTPPAEAAARLSQVVAASPADETAITWIERRRATVLGKPGSPRPPRHELELQVRVLEAGRPGAFRPASADPAELAWAIREAMAAARVAEPLPAGATLTPPASDGPALAEEVCFDPQVAALELEEGQRLLRELARPGEIVRLSWCELALAVVTSRGLAREVRATSVELAVRTRRQPGAGLASGAARTLSGLAAAELFDRARRRDAGDAPLGDWQAPAAVVLAGEAAATLLAALADELLDAQAWEDPAAFGPRHRGAPIVSGQLSLRDDPAAPWGLPLPFARTGAAATAATLVEGGVLRGPCADPVWAARLDVPPTAPVWLGEAPRAEHPTIVPGALSKADLLLAAGDGVFVSDVERVEVWDRGTLGARLLARGVRRLANGVLAEPLPDAVWEVSLPEALAAVRGVGAEPVARERAGCLGGVAAPGLALAAAGEWRAIEGQRGL